MRRQAPRPLGRALEAAKRELAPMSALAQVQACWPDVVGEALARQAAPVGVGGGTLTVACESAVWAQELELMGPALVERLNEVLAAPGGPALRVLRARVGPLP